MACILEGDMTLAPYRRVVLTQDLPKEGLCAGRHSARALAAPSSILSELPDSASQQVPLSAQAGADLPRFVQKHGSTVGRGP